MRFLLILFLMISFSFGESAEKLKDVTLQLQWKSTFEFAGFYMAKEKGYYKDAGLNVNIKEWEYGIDVAKDIINGKAEYGVLRPSSLIDISQGDDLVYLLAVYQSNPLVLLADKKSHIKSIKDMKNKRIMATKDHLKDASIVSLLVSQDIKLSEIKTIKHSFNVLDLLDDKADLMVSYVSNEPFLLEEAGGSPIIFNSKDYGFDFYNDILAVDRAYLKNNPDEVKKFREATIKGYEYIFSHVDETIDLIYNRYNTLKKSKKALSYEARELKKLAYYKTNTIGDISYKKLEKVYYIYRLLGLIKKDIDINSIIYKDIDSDIKLSKKEKIYLQNKSYIKLCADPDWLPFDKIDEDGKNIGISADYIKLIEKFLSTDIRLIETSSWYDTLEKAKSKKCDIITSITETPNRKKYLNFTTSYAKFPMVVATRMEVPFVSGAKDLYGKKVGVIKGSAFFEVAEREFPQIDIVNTKNIEDGLEKVNSGELFAIVDSIPSLAYSLQSNKSQNIKISGNIYNDWEFKIAVRNDDLTLLNIMQKAIDNITEEQKQKIFNKWISIKYENGLDYGFIVKIMAIGLILLISLVFMILWNRKINAINSLLKNAHKEIEIKNKKLDFLATTDKLTGIYNRLKLDNILDQEIKRSQRYNDSFGVCMLDIDYFKKINDTYGHQAGDEVLKEVAKILKKMTRKTDTVGRWGGEEFLIICLGVDKDNLYALIEKIRLHIKGHNFPYIKHNITASFGITIYKDGDFIESIIRRADEALYKAKHKGRNNVVVC